MLIFCTWHDNFLPIPFVVQNFFFLYHDLASSHQTCPRLLGLRQWNRNERRHLNPTPSVDQYNQLRRIRRPTIIPSTKYPIKVQIYCWSTWKCLSIQPCINHLIKFHISPHGEALFFPSVHKNGREFVAIIGKFSHFAHIS